MTGGHRICGVVEWRQVPWSLWTFAALTLVSVVLVEVKTNGPIPPRILFPLVMLTWVFFLLKGVRWLWILTLVVSVLGFANDLISKSLTPQAVAFGLAGLVLLLVPATRRYFAGEPTAADA
jgi:hypothetical protein